MSVRNISALLIAAAALAACGGGPKENDEGADDGTRIIEGKGATFDEAADDVIRKLDEARAGGRGEGWVELGDEEAAVVREDLRALDAAADARSGAEIAAAIDAYRHGAGASGYFDGADFPYRPSEYGQITDLPANAAADGITGAAGLVLDAPDGPFKSVLVSYLVFDAQANAVAYRGKLDRNFTQSMVEPVSFDLTRDDHDPIKVRCVYVPDSDNSVNCHHMGPSGRTVASTLFAGGPALDFSGDETAIELVFNDAESERRIMDTVAETAAYLYDAAQP